MMESDLLASARRRVTASLALVAFAFALAALLSVVSVFAADPAPLDREQLQRTFIAPAENFRPEPTERLLFVVGVVASPFLILACYLGARRLASALEARRLAILDRFLLLGLSGAVVGVALHSYRNFEYQLASAAEMALGAMALPVAGALAWLLCAGRAEGMRARLLPWLGRIAHVVALALVCLSFLLSVFSLDAVTENSCFTASFNAVFHAVAQVFNGKGLLVDLTHQYGLYPHFLVPLFRLTGLNVLGFTATMGALTAASFVCIYLVLRRVVASRLIAGLFCSGMIFANYLFMRIVSTEFYFQYHPVRTIFPAVSMLLTQRYFSHRSRTLYYVAFAVYAVAMLWNFETGFVVFSAWLLVLLYDELPTRSLRPLLAHLGRGVAVCGAVVGAFSLSLRAAYGRFPDYADLFHFHQVYYGLGYMMLPMPSVGFWTLLAALYALALIACAEALVSRARTALSRQLFFVAVLGIGLFAYYQGRSCDPVLLGVLYPSTVVLAVLTERLTLAATRERLAVAAVPVALSLFPMLFALGLLGISGRPLLARLSATIPRAVIAASAPLRGSASPAPPGLARVPALQGWPANLEQNIRLVRAHTKPGEEVLILSGHSGIYHLYSGTASPLRIPGPAEWYLVEELKAVEDYVLRGKWEKVFIDRSHSWTKNPGLARLDAIISTRYRLIGAGPSRSMRVYASERG